MLFALFGRACSPKHRGASENIVGVSEKRVLAKGRPEQAVSADLVERLLPEGVLLELALEARALARVARGRDLPAQRHPAQHALP